MSHWLHSFMFPANWGGWRWLAVGWLLTITFLFFMPGSALPKQSWLNDLQIDKLVHIVFFAILVFLWRFYFDQKVIWTWILIVTALLYGIAVEMIQDRFIINRSFDMYDVVADLAGAIAGGLVWHRVYKKNKPL